MPIIERRLSIRVGSLIAAITASCCCSNSQVRVVPGKPGGRAMVKAYTGRQIPLNVAASEAQAVVAGELLEAGQISMGGPGQAYYDGAKVRVVETLSGDVKPEITIAYTRQTMPEQAAEAEPQIREVYLFFLTLRSDGTWRATKIDAASEQNKAAVKRLLGGPAPHR